MKKKNFTPFPGGALRDLARGFGGCLATDMITVEGKKVGFMYREAPDFEADTGWRFTSGYESDEYMNIPDNLDIYDVNTIANYDEDILPYLDRPVGSAFERTNGNRFVSVELKPPES